MEPTSQFLELSKGFLPRKCHEKLWKLRALYLPAVDKIKGRGRSRVGMTAGPRARWAEMGTCFLAYFLNQAQGSHSYSLPSQLLSRIFQIL